MRLAAAIVVAVLAVAAAPVPQLPTTHVLNAQFKPGGPRYEYLPFDVSADTASVSISYSYSGDGGASVVDLGLFEPGPLTIGTSSFRGYSGGSQRTIVVGRNHASPGYKTGPLPAGRWHVMLGLYRVAPEGVNVEIKIGEARVEGAGPERSAASAAGPDSPKRRRRAGDADAPAWYSGALHLHTKHSDGVLSPAELSAAAGDAGLDFIVITDHNNTTHTREPLPSSPLYITGEELTTPGGHATVLGLPAGAWIDFRVSRTDPNAAETVNGLVEQAHRAGGLFAISHPVDTCGGCSWDHAIPTDIDAVEIWQDNGDPRGGAVAFWDRLLRNGRRVTAIGVSDWHRPSWPIDKAAVRVLAGGLTTSAILDGIRGGHVIVMRDAQTAPPSVRAHCGSTAAGIGESLTCKADEELAVHLSMPTLSDGRADFIWNAARMTSKAVGRGTTFTMPAATGYLRVHVVAADGSTVAITNPIYVTTR